jgi:hydroxymethylglutaryl-CoA reductase
MVMENITKGNEKRSDLQGFHKLTPDERLEKVKEFAGLSDEEAGILRKNGALDIDTADRMIENVVGTSELPFGIATNFLINGKDYLVPMTLEEPSVVAAASFAAKLTRPTGGFETSSSEPVMIGQIQMVNIGDMETAKENIAKEKDSMIKSLNETDPALLVKYGGGVKDIQARDIETKRGRMLIMHILVDCRDVMGANAINTICESLSPKLENLTGGKARLRIISNLAVHRTARARAVWKKELLEESVRNGMKGEEVVDRILDAYAFAEADPYRCATHNKGIMNGIDAVVISTGNDFRAIEAGAHSYAARNGGYECLTKYSKDDRGNLVGEIELPLAVAIFGGATMTKPSAKVALKIIGAKTATELAEVIVAVGLAQNFAALRALATEGIQGGHMRLHAKNIAVMAGAKGNMIDRIAEKMADEKNVRIDRAKELLNDLEAD